MTMFTPRLTSHLPSPAVPASWSLHRSLLRLRARWLGWRGRAVLRAVPGPAGGGRGAYGDASPHVRGLFELNLKLERARAHRSSPGQRPELAG